MKKALSITLALVMLLSIFVLTAHADDKPAPTVDGIYGLDIKVDDCTIEFYNEAGEKLTASDDYNLDGFYAEAAYMMLTVSNVAEGQYLVLAQSDENAPTEQNILYVDQDAPTSETLTFKIYPSEFKSGTNYIKFYSKAIEGGALVVATFEYYTARMLGDVYQDGVINANDALTALQIAGNLITYSEADFKAADVYKDGVVNANDALLILQYAGQLITSFD